MYNAIFYLVVAVFMIVINPKRVLYGRKVEIEDVEITREIQ